MATENVNHKDKMRLTAPGQNGDIERRIRETETLLINTRRFLDHLSESQVQSCAYIREQGRRLEERLDHLIGERERKNPSPSAT